RRGGFLLSLESAQGSQGRAMGGGYSRRAILCANDVGLTLIEVDGVPAQGHKLTDPPAMPIGGQDQGCVAGAVPVLSCRLHEQFDFGAGQILSGSNVGIALARRGLGAVCCPIIGSWGYQFEVCFSHVFQCSCKLSCPINSPTWDKRREGARN